MTILAALGFLWLGLLVGFLAGCMWAGPRRYTAGWYDGAESEAKRQEFLREKMESADACDRAVAAVRVLEQSGRDVYVAPVRSFVEEASRS